ncbi:MAG TPA: 1,4-dihydroxy-2-naphthoate octaprenyltransferase [Clostridia bacterium]|nr:1,4-dihydroxy-2-naphthoate octaprenyltransferase [Clostridia bacterium]
MEKFKSLVKAARFSFLTATIVPVSYGTALGFYKGKFDFCFFLWTLIGSAILHLGTNLINNYFDYLNGSDVINLNRTPFNGGTDVIVKGQIKAETVAKAAFACYTIGAAIGFYLAYHRGIPVFYLGMAGIILSYLYSAPPVSLMSRGLGEFTVGLCFGPLLVIGAYYVQTQVFDPAVLFAGIPLGLLITAVLYVNQFPDYEADKKVRKANWIVRLGLKRAVKWYYVLISLAYIFICLQVGLRVIPLTALAGLLTLPLALKAFSIIKDNFDQIQAMVPCMAATIGLHFITGSLLVVSLILAQIFRI